MVFSEGEAQQLIEILSEKAGIVQDTWHTVGLWAPRWPFTAGLASLPSLGRESSTFFWQVGALLTSRASSGDLELIFFCWKERAGSCPACWVAPAWGGRGGFGGGGPH